MSLVKKIISKLKSGAWFPFYNSFYENLKVDDRLILIESRGGNALEGNMFRICEELSKEDYRDFTKIISVRKSSNHAVKEKLFQYGITGVHFVQTGSIKYYYYLSKAGYLVNDTSFPGRFIKKTGQVYLNTWHGTPLKKMGRDNKNEIYSMGNVMRNLIQSDYLIFPNYYMEEKMSEAYMLQGLFQGRILREGYPRNSIFFQDASRNFMRQKLHCEEKQVVVYMPTFRGNVENMETEKQCFDMEDILKKIDGKLRENQVFYIKLHPLMKGKVDTASFKNIKTVPDKYDVYDVLNASDVLVTDYSSVFYDYAISKRKIILFTYDEEEYYQTRGIYETLEQYPFKKVKTVEELLYEINNPEKGDREEFRKRYCSHENEHAVRNICKHVFRHEKICQEVKMHGNGKENILIYAGDLNKNGITTALWSMLEGMDKERFNYFLSFRKINVEKEPERLWQIPKECGIIPIASEMSMDMLTMIAQMMYLRKGNRSKWVTERLDKAYQREWKKHFGNIEFRHVIHYNGYERYIISLIQCFAGKKTIWVHNDMVSEIKEKGNQNYYQLQDAYKKYDNVVVVSEDIRISTQSISGREDNILVIENCHDYKKVRLRAEESLQFDEDTESTMELEKLKEILDSNAVKFINIGRYSIEKGHKRLIQAFEKYWENHRETYLIIIGGTGDLYSQTIQWAKRSRAFEHIILIKSMKNPMPILKKCQLFILSSIYEGLGLVMLEADTLGVPVVACNVVGPSGFLKEHHGTLVENSEEGIYEGMIQYSEEKVSCMNVDYEKLNQINIRKCERIL